MDRKTGAMVGAAAALIAGPAIADAATSEPAVPVAASYAELLQPIPNATERLKLAEAQDAAQPARLIEAQYNPGYAAHHHHHHHHHHHWRSRAWYLSHGYVWNNGRWWPPRLQHHHHHHHN